MSTYMAKAGQVDRKWYIIDAAGKPLGRVAAQAAVLLRGKHKPEQKKWYRHTGWIGHLKETDYGTLMEKRPEKAMELAVKGMIPDTTIGRAARLRLRAFAGSTHTHAAQKPEAFEF